MRKLRTGMRVGYSILAIVGLAGIAVGVLMTMGGVHLESTSNTILGGVITFLSGWGTLTALRRLRFWQ